MTTEEQRIAIAEWMGLNPTRDGYCPNPKSKGVHQLHASYSKIPDYCNDLNAIHEAEEAVFNKKDWTRYTDILIDLVAKNESPIRATAAQRAEALCRTLWPERWTK